jgi:hypothetical protein
VRLALKQADAKVKAPDVGPAKKAIVDFDKAIEDSNRRVEESYNKVDKQIQKAEESIDKLTRKNKDSASASEEMAKSSDKLRGSMAKVGRAALSAARGIILLTGAKQEDTEKMTRWIVVGEGTIQATMAMVQITKTLTTVTKAQIAANVALVASIPGIGWAITAVTALVSAAGAAYLLLAEDSEKSADRQVAAIKKIQMERQRQKTEEAGDIESRVSDMAARRGFGRVSKREEEDFRRQLREDVKKYMVGDEAILGHEGIVAAAKAGEIQSFEGELAGFRKAKGVKEGQLRDQLQRIDEQRRAEETRVRERGQRAISALPESLDPRSRRRATKEIREDIGEELEGIEQGAKGQAARLRKEFAEWFEENKEQQEGIIDHIIENKRELRQLKMQMDTQ